MKKIIILLIFISPIFQLYSIEEEDILTTINTIVDLSKKYEEEGKVNKITVLYNTYSILKSEVSETALNEEYDEYYENLFYKNSVYFKNLIISIDKDPTLDNSKPNIIQFKGKK